MVNDLVVVSGSIILTVIIIVVIIMMIIFIPTKNNSTAPNVIITPVTPQAIVSSKNIKISSNKKVLIPPSPKKEVKIITEQPVEKIEAKIALEIKADKTEKTSNSLTMPSIPIVIDTTKLFSDNEVDSMKNITKVIVSEEPQFEEFNDEIVHNQSIKDDLVLDLIQPTHKFELGEVCTMDNKVINNTYWSETGSWGKKCFRDKPFELSEEGAFYVVSEKVIDDPGIIDMVEFNGEIHYLYNNNTIRVGNKKYRLKARETKAIFETIVAYGKHLLALADGGLYYLYKQRGSRWSFRPVDLANFNEIANITSPIIRISYGPYLAIQTEKYLYLYDADGIMIERIIYLNTHKRVYGKSKDIYADIDLVANIAKLSTARSRFTNVVDAIISNNGNLVPITTERHKETGYTGIRQINGEIYFLKG